MVIINIMVMMKFMKFIVIIKHDKFITLNVNRKDKNLNKKCEQIDLKGTQN